LRFAWYLCVQLLVFIAWVVFRSPTLGDASVYFGNLFASEFSGIPQRLWFPLIIGFSPVLIMHVRGFVAERAPALRVGAEEKAILAAILLIATLTLYGQDSAFIYFQF
jgi:hypothetical protein